MSLIFIFLEILSLLFLSSRNTPYQAHPRPHKQRICNILRIITLLYKHKKHSEGFTTTDGKKDYHGLRGHRNINDNRVVRRGKKHEKGREVSCHRRVLRGCGPV